MRLALLLLPAFIARAFRGSQGVFAQLLQFRASPHKSGVAVQRLPATVFAATKRSKGAGSSSIQLADSF